MIAWAMFYATHQCKLYLTIVVLNLQHMNTMAENMDDVWEHHSYKSCNYMNKH